MIRHYVGRPVSATAGNFTGPGLFCLALAIMFSVVSIPALAQQTITIDETDSSSASLDSYASPGITGRSAGIIKIKKEDFNEGFNLSPAGLTAGRLPGLMTRLTDGSPSSGYDLTSMRNSSFFTSLTPLMVVDGVPVMGAPVMINPLDIESITWLQGSAASEYGSLARNGVLLIKTKKGKPGFHLTYTGQGAFSSVRKYDVLSGDQVRAALLSLYPDDPGTLELAGTANTDWQDEIYRTAFSHNHHISLSGTLASVPFRVSAGQTIARGTIRSLVYSKTSFAGRIDPSLFDDHLRISLVTSGSSASDRSPGEYLPYYAASADPTKPVYANNDPDQGYSSGPYFINPVAFLEDNDYHSRPGHLSASLHADYKMHLLPGLRMSMTAAAGKYSEESRNVTQYLGTFPVINGTITSLAESLKTRVLDLSAGYSASIEGINARIDARGGYFMYWLGRDYRETMTACDNPDVVVGRTHTVTEMYRTGLYGNIDMSFSGKYFLFTTLGRESFSEFAENNRSIFSPSLTAEWKISGESFFPSDGLIDDLALSLTLGSAGSGITPGSASAMPSPGLRPESGRYFIPALRLSMAGNRVHLAVNAFINSSRDIITEFEVPFSSLSGKMLVNAGTIDTRGIEMRAEATLLSEGDFKWNGSLWFTLRETRIKSLANSIDFIMTGSAPLMPYVNVMIQEAGKPVNTFYLLKQVYDGDGMPIEGLYEDYNNNGFPGMDDRYYGPSADPEFAAGIWSSLRYRNWELSFSASALAGNWCYNIESVFGCYGRLVTNNALRNIPSLVYESEFTGMNTYSDYHLENGSFLRLDFISLGHTLQDVGSKNMDIRLEATLQNAFIISAYRGADPDTGGGLSGYPWPKPRTATLTAGIDF